MKLTFKTELNKTMHEVFESFNRDFFEYLTPPLAQIKIKTFEGVDVNNKFDLEIKSYLGSQKWSGQITQRVVGSDECFFVDVGVDLPFPLTRWTHKHRVLSLGNKNSVMIDEIDFDAKVGFKNISKLIMTGFFLYRKSKYKQFFS